MFTSEALKVGDRVDHGDYRNGVVRRVGLGTIYAEFATAYGMLPLNGPKDSFRRHVEVVAAVRVGEFTLSRGVHVGKVWIQADNGESGEFEEARLEAALRKFWNQQF
jgi:hypothetical protein